MDPSEKISSTRLEASSTLSEDTRPVAEQDAKLRPELYRNVITYLEDRAGLDRTVEFLPSDDLLSFGLNLVSKRSKSAEAAPGHSTIAHQLFLTPTAGVENLT